MVREHFASPREEALDIALETRKSILSGSGDALKILHGCIVIASNLGKNQEIGWMNRELSGSFNKETFPTYRRISCEVTAGFNNNHYSFEKYNVLYSVSALEYRLKTKDDLLIMLDSEDPNTLLHIRPDGINEILGAIIERCFSFLNEIIKELQFGGVVEYLMEEIRRNTDSRLAEYDVKMFEETQSIYLNLTSTNPADWIKVGHSCRRLLRLLANCVIPPSEEKYQLKDGRVLKMTEDCFTNRLLVFMEKNSNAEERKFLNSELNYLESYLRQVVDYSQMVEHHPSIDKYHANLLVIHTYLVISEIMRHKTKGLADRESNKP